MSQGLVEAHPHTGSDFARLSRRIAEAGLMERRPRYYAFRIGTVAALYIAAWAVFFALGDSWLQLAMAVVLAVLFTQAAFVAHDLAHRQVFRTRRASECAGRLAGNLAVGMSYGWWMDKHTRHHANPNHEELDPDVEANVFVWSQRQAKLSAGFARFIGRRQALWFFPLLTFEAYNLHVASVRGLFRPTLRGRRVEGALLLAHAVAYVGAVFLVLSPGKAVAFIALQQGLFGLYLGAVFAHNHKGMLNPDPDRPLDFLRRQVLTTRDVSGGLLTDIALGGLNYQIEHHLFPSMSAAHLRRAQVIVRAYCAELGIPYHETTLFESYAETLRHLHSAGAPIRAAIRHGAPATDLPA